MDEVGTDSPPESGKRTAAGRLLSLLGAFSQGTGALTLSELSRSAGLTLTTTHRLVQELRAWEGLDVDESGRYRLSLKVLELASTSTQGLRLREKALPHLADLHRRTGLTIQLAVRNDDKVMSLESLRLHPNLGGENRIGGQLPLHVAATGLVLLAYGPPAFADEYANGPLRRYTPQTIGDADALMRELEQIRRDRYAHTQHTAVPGWGMIAAPVTDANHEVEAAVGAIYWIDAGVDAYIDTVRATAEHVSRTLSHPSPRPSSRTLEFQRRHTGVS